MDNEFILVQDFIKSIFEEDASVKLVTRVPFEDIGVQKNMGYPFVNIDYTGCNYNEGKIIYNFTIYALNKRDISKIPITNWWDLNDNRITNLQSTELILRKFIMKVKNLNNKYDINVETYTDLTAGMVLFMDMLDGHSIDITISITNNTEVC